MFALLIGSTLLTWHVGNQIRSAMTTQLNVLTAADKVEQYGDMLAISIKMVVNHGDREAAAEYRRVQPRLRQVLTGLHSQLEAGEQKADVITVNGSDLELIAMEYRALDLVTRGRMDEARRIIYSDRYAYLVDVYVQGTQSIQARATRYAESIRWQLNNYIWLIVGMSAASLVLVIVGWLALVMPTRRWGQRVERDREVALHASQLLELKQQELERVNAQLFDQARTDPLTGLHTRLKFNEVLADLWPRLQRNVESASVMICDIDFFKQYNDTCGHLAGDEVLRAVARALDATRRSGDQLYRMGGEEFLIVLHGCTAEAATARAEDFRAAVERLGIIHSASPWGRITISVGVAALGGAGTLQGCLRQADEAMYKAKSTGRNGVVSSPRKAA